MELLIIAAILSSIIPLSVYLIYIIAALTSRSRQFEPLSSLPEISMVIPAYNEEDVIAERIKNIAESYPVELIEMIIANDASADNTKKIAIQTMNECKIKGRVVDNEKRSGVNFAVNHGVSEATRDIIVLTGADGKFDKDTVPKLLAGLLSSQDIGAVSGNLIPVSYEKSVTTRSEDAYRSIYGKICTWESNIHSTYCFNGPVTALRKKARANVHITKGADDASTALGIIRNGYRCLYVQDARFYEYIPARFNEQKRQKIRRATRLLEATLAHLDLVSIKYGSFGTVVFPLRILMFLVCPLSIFTAIILWFFILYQINILYGSGLIAFLIILIGAGYIRTNFISSFLLYQWYLFMGLLNLFRDMHIWEPTERR